MRFSPSLAERAVELWPPLHIGSGASEKTRRRSEIYHIAGQALQSSCRPGAGSGHPAAAGARRAFLKRRLNDLAAAPVAFDAMVEPYGTVGEPRVALVRVLV